MAISFDTNNPQGLLASFKKAIADKHIVTWAVDSDGDFTHTPDQWRNKAWLRPVVLDGRLTLRFLGHPHQITTKEVYAVYHGRYIEAMTAHFDDRFTVATATARATNSDHVTTKVA